MDGMNLNTASTGASAGAVVVHASRLFVQAFSAAQRALHVSPMQYRVILELRSQDGLTQKDLIAKLDVEQSTIGNTLNRMEQDGLIERKRHPNDGRAQILCLTHKSLDIIGPASENANRVNEKALVDFSETEKQQLFVLMQKLIGGLKNQSSSV